MSFKDTFNNRIKQKGGYMDLRKLNYDENVVTDAVQILGEYYFRLEGIPEIKIKIKLYKYFDRDDICFSLSHFIHTPEQVTVYIPSSIFAETEEIAFERALKSITNYYNDAIKKGNTPEKEWLVENTNY